MTCKTFYFDPDSRAVHAYANQQTGRRPLVPILCGGTKHDIGVMATKAIHLAMADLCPVESESDSVHPLKKSDMSLEEIVDATLAGPRFATLTPKQQQAIDDFKWKIDNGVELTPASVKYLGDLFDRALGRGNFA